MFGVIYPLFLQYLPCKNTMFPPTSPNNKGSVSSELWFQIYFFWVRRLSSLWKWKYWQEKMTETKNEFLGSTGKIKVGRVCGSNNFFIMLLSPNFLAQTTDKPSVLATFIPMIIEVYPNRSLGYRIYLNDDLKTVKKYRRRTVGISKRWASSDYSGSKMLIVWIPVVWTI